MQNSVTTRRVACLLAHSIAGPGALFLNKVAIMRPYDYNDCNCIDAHLAESERKPCAGVCVPSDFSSVFYYFMFVISVIFVLFFSA